MPKETQSFDLADTRHRCGDFGDGAMRMGALGSSTSQSSGRAREAAVPYLNVRARMAPSDSHSGGARQAAVDGICLHSHSRSNDGLNGGDRGSGTGGA